MSWGQVLPGGCSCGYPCKAGCPADGQGRSELPQHLRDTATVSPRPQDPQFGPSGLRRGSRVPRWVPAPPGLCCSEGMGGTMGLSPGPAEIRAGWSLETPASPSPPCPNLLPLVIYWLSHREHGLGEIQPPFGRGVRSTDTHCTQRVLGVSQAES